MQRIRVLLGLAAVLGLGTATALGGQYMSQYWNKNGPADGIHWGPQYSPQVPVVQGPWGQPVEMAAPYNFNPPNGADAARSMLSTSMPLDLIQQSGYFKDSSYPIIQAGGQCPGGACMAPGGGMSPPGIGAAPPGGLPPGLAPPGAVAAVGALTGGPAAAPFPISRTEVRFVGPAGMKISWYGPSADGKGSFGPQFLQAPARYNFLQASIYRLKLTGIPNRPGVELYPTLEVVPAKPKTCTFLAHSAVPIVFTEEDFEQVAAGNFVVKVIYLPDPQFQDLAATGPDEVVSSRLDPGVDPIVEAKRRGSILLVVRLGNIDLEAPNTPAMDAPNPFAPAPPVAPPGAVPPPGLPPVPGVPMAGLPPMPNQPSQMAPNMPGRVPMSPYGMLNGPPPLPPGAIPMPSNSNMPAPGQMLPPASSGSGSYPVGSPLPAQQGPSSGPGTYPIGAPFPGPSSMPTSQAAPSGELQKTQYQTTSATPARPPALVDLAGQPLKSGSASVSSSSMLGSR